MVNDQKMDWNDDWRKFLRLALTVEISINPAPLDSVIQQALEDYARHNYQDIANGNKNPLHAGHPAVPAYAIQWIRHNLTNYDQVYPLFEEHDKYGHGYQIIFGRTLRLIGKHYPKLARHMRDAISRQTPLEQRHVVLYPCSTAEIIQEVQVSTQETIGQRKLSHDEWKELTKNHILNNRTDYRWLTRDYAALPLTLKEDLSSQALDEAMALIDVAFPDLDEAVNRLVEDMYATGTDLGSPFNPQDSPDVALIHPSRRSGFSLDPLPLAELLATTANSVNEDRFKSPTQAGQPSQVALLSPEGDERMQAEIRLRSIAHLLHHHSNYHRIRSKILTVPLEFRYEARAGLEADVHAAISHEYPLLRLESRAESRRRLYGGKPRFRPMDLYFRGNTPPITELSLEGLLILGVERFNASAQASLPYTVQSPIVTERIHVAAVEFARKELEALHPEWTDFQVLDCLAVIHPLLVPAIEKVRMVLATKAITTRLRFTGQAITEADIRVYDGPWDAVCAEALAEHNLRIESGIPPFFPYTAALDLASMDEDEQMLVAQCCLTWIRRQHSNMTELMSHIHSDTSKDVNVRKSLVQELQRKVNERIRTAYPELSEAVDRDLALLLPEQAA